MSLTQKLGSIIIVDPDKGARESLTRFVNRHGYKTVAYSSGTEAIADFRSQQPATHNPQTILVLAEYKLPNMSGLDFITSFKKICTNTPVIMMSSCGTIEVAVEATHRGAYDFVEKPFQFSQLENILRRANDLAKLKRENHILRKQVNSTWVYADMIGKSKAMKEVFHLIDRVAPVPVSVLIMGENGTGKEVVAKAIHAKSPRRDKPFVAINCSAIPENLLESELFGHLKGAFTGADNSKPGLFEEADGGTIFLDEIGDMAVSLQAKILRVLQDHKIKPVGDVKYKHVDVRVISATHKKLKQEIRKGLFREDLYYRLCVIPITIPPLRERQEDIPILANHFLERFVVADDSPIKSFSDGAMQCLVHARWDGNVRELENVIERTVVLCSKEIVCSEDIPLFDDLDGRDFFGEATSDWPSVETLEKRYIEFILKKTGGQKERASKILGLNRRTLYRKEKEFNQLTAVSSPH